ncbi:uncharacterized protein PSFLO_04650 [Pseudozyma flocculosa]|uniref:Uncharacterized protein n=1 Tax=Pseudozyma flocculosa TaxID=84751 RepID=A0A5C3F7C9_9BASI|nr:uncharacterized protein PSFLO_04650 [Pseudozyma flocculosa]
MGQLGERAGSGWVFPWMPASAHFFPLPALLVGLPLDTASLKHNDIITITDRRHPQPPTSPPPPPAPAPAPTPLPTLDTPSYWFYTGAHSRPTPRRRHHRARHATVGQTDPRTLATYRFRWPRHPPAAFHPSPPHLAAATAFVLRTHPRFFPSSLRHTVVIVAAAACPPPPQATAAAARARLFSPLLVKPLCTRTLGPCVSLYTSSSSINIIIIIIIITVVTTATGTLSP